MLHLAVAVNSLPIIAELVLYGANFDAKDGNDNTPLHYAASLGQLELCSFLVEKGCKVDIRNKKRMTALHASILSDDREVLDYFVEILNENNNPKVTKNLLEGAVARGMNSLHIAIENNSFETFKYMLQYDVDLNLPDAQKKTPLHTAIELGIDLIG